MAAPLTPTAAAAAPPPPPFAVIFTASPVGYPIQSTAFTPVAPGRWLLDVRAVTPDWRTLLKDCTLFLTAPGALPPGSALALYVSVGGDEWQYRGAVTAAHPSDAVPLAWPEPSPAAAAAGGAAAPVLGVALEAEADVAGRECAKLASRLEFGRRVGLDFLHFVESFAGAGGAIVLPAGALDAWWRKFEARFRRDPEWLLRGRQE